MSFVTQMTKFIDLWKFFNELHPGQSWEGNAFWGSRTEEGWYSSPYGRLQLIEYPVMTHSSTKTQNRNQGLRLLKCKILTRVEI